MRILGSPTLRSQRRRTTQGPPPNERSPRRHYMPDYYILLPRLRPYRMRNLCPDGPLRHYPSRR
jgi:hypothetical protein